MKTCTKCGGEPKPLSEFSNNAKARDGRRSNCKLCDRLATAARNAANPEKRRASVAKYRAANPENEKAACAKWRATNPEKAKEANAKWRASNTERHIAAKAKWAAANPESNRIRKQNRRARKIANGGRLSPGLAAKLFKLQRGKCACCHVSIADGNHLDHNIPVALGGPNEDWNMQLLCPPCNLQKHAKHPIDFMQSRGFLL